MTAYLFGYEVDNPSAEYMKYKVFEEPYSGTVNETYYSGEVETSALDKKKSVEKLQPVPVVNTDTEIMHLAGKKVVAAACVIGGSANGNIMWLYSDGESIKDKAIK